MNLIDIKDIDKYKIKDKFGVEYSLDMRTLLRISNPELEEYEIKNECVDINPNALKDSKLKTISFPISVLDRIDLYDLPESLENIHIEKNDDYYSSIDGVLFNRKQTDLLYFPPNHCKEYIIPNTTKRIVKDAFCGSHISSVIIPESVKLIDNRAFSYCTELETVIIIGSNITISGVAFLGSENIKEIIIVANEVYEKDDRIYGGLTIGSCKITLLVNKYISDLVGVFSNTGKEINLNILDYSKVEVVVPVGTRKKFNKLVDGNNCTTIREINQREGERIMDLVYQHAAGNEYVINLAKEFIDYIPPSEENRDDNNLEFNMKDYSIKELVIVNNQMIEWRDFCDYDKVKTVYIVKDFDIDDDCGNHFGGMKSLERFVVCNEKSRFYTEDGVLFVNIEKSVEDKIREKEMFCHFPKNIAGKVLVAFPTNYSQKKYSIPNGTIAIAKGAFESTNIEELTIPSSICFVDLHALTNTNNLRVLRVPNSKEIFINDQFYMGKEGDFNIISNNENEELSEDIIHLWDPESVEMINRDEDNLGKVLYENYTYCHEIVWPNDNSQTELSAALMSKQIILSYYLKARRSSVNDKIMLALFFFLIDTHMLHPSSSQEAELILEMLFGKSNVDEDWLKKYAGSPENFKILHQLLKTDKVRFLDYVGSSTMSDLLKSRAKDILKPLAKKGYIGAIVNLLHIGDIYPPVEEELLIKQAAQLGYPESIWLLASKARLKEESEKEMALKLWKRLSEDKNLLPSPNKEDIQWLARNNLKWMKTHKYTENTFDYQKNDLDKYLNIYYDEDLESPF